MRIYNKPNYKHLRRKLRGVGTQAEVLLWSRLRNNKLGVKFRRQYGVGRHVLDFYCPRLKLGIELDGEYHYRKDVCEYDLIREEYLRACGIKLLRFNNAEVLQNIDLIVNCISEKVQNPPLAKGRAGRGK